MQPTATRQKQCLSDFELRDLDEIVLWDPANWVDLIVRRSEHVGLEISGDEVMLQRYQCARRGKTLYIKLGGNLMDRVSDALTTSLTRKRIHIDLTLQSLSRIRATGMVDVDMVGWNGIEPEIHLFGPAALWAGRFPVKKP